MESYSIIKFLQTINNNKSLYFSLYLLELFFILDALFRDLTMLQYYTKDKPFIAKIKERYSLCIPGSKKNTQHIVLDLSGSNIQYEVGDSIGVWPSYDPELIETILNKIKASGNETVHEKRGESIWNLREYLSVKANITDLSKKLLSNIYEKQASSFKKEYL
jgi:sulfite reductase (NADPH) flavoprotein alpha-component